MKHLCIFLLSLAVHALALDRPKLRILNAGPNPVEVFWVNANGQRVPNGVIAPGRDAILGTTLGHRFVIVDADKEVEVISQVPVQGFRYDPAAKDGIPPFYTQVVRAGGYPICASAKVNPYALKEAAYLIDMMLSRRPDVREAMVKSGSRLCILAHNEFTCDQPEWAWLANEPVKDFESIPTRDYRDARARGMGGSLTDPYCSCAEENLLAYDGDPYSTECILIHELAHNIHLRGMSNVDPTFDRRVKAAYDAAMDAGLWKGKYASVNHHEYFAEGVQSWFDNNREPDHDHNHVNTRAELLEYDPGLASLCREVFGETVLKYTKPQTRLTGHLAGYDPSKAPKFTWPPHLEKARELIRAKARVRSDAATKVVSALAEKDAAKSTATLPNILLILADDLGYGDVRCYNTQAKVPTPNIDSLASQGMRFTDAHSPATVCTPTRYSLLTGHMAFRVPNGGTVFTGAGGPSLISKGRLTLPAMLKQQGYATAMVGKWHIGLTFRDASGAPIHSSRMEDVSRIDYSRRIEGGPLDCGFDQFFGTACCPTTDWLYAFIHGDRIPIPPTQPLDKTKLPRHPYANDCRPGLIAPDFDMQEVDMIFLEKSREFIAQHARSTPAKPFFLFHSAQAVHLPSFAGKDFRGKTQAGPHGDFISQFDHIVGELLRELDKHGLADNTLVILSSDNGPEVTTVVHMRTDHAHDGARPWRGVKRDAWEGGHRVPLIVRWPARVKPGTTSSQLTSLTDLMATMAAVTGTELPHDAAEDSFNLLPALEDSATAPIRPYLLMQAFGGARTLSIRRGQWKYIAHPGSGGNNYDRGELKPYALPDSDPKAPAQLYDLSTDPGETTNLYSQKPEIVKELQALLEQSKTTGRSRP